MSGYEINCGGTIIIMAAVVIKDLTLPHPMGRLWLTLLGFLVVAVIILLGWIPPVVHISLDHCMAAGTTTCLYKDCVSIIANIIKFCKQVAAVIWLTCA